ncbi:hypothetical protein [Mycobacteroides abscessus]|uniref:hypothetical protein n=1 Tax=Mycobacteroides abscessus TaxID=36809 RepID=UPI0012FFD64A|nr:hypothetical protein [Mycobacteroides abscessus]
MAAIPTTSCAAPAATTAISSSWLSQLGNAVAAGLIVEGAKAALPELWRSWQGSRQAAYDSLRDDGYPWVSNYQYGDSVPPAIFFSVSRKELKDTSSDLLVFCVESGAHIAFVPWAWQALVMCINDLTSGKEGDTLSGFRALCKISLIPAAIIGGVNSPLGYSELLSYKARNGEVELNRSMQSDGSTRVQIIATGIPVANGGPTMREFTLPKPTPTITSKSKG